MKKTALITGASSGLGVEFAKLFAQDGYDLVLIARREERLEKLAQEVHQNFGIKSHIITKDLSNPRAPEEIFKELNQQSVLIHALVNNAGTQVYGKFQETDLTKQIQMLQINLMALTSLTKLTIDQMLANHIKGKILQIGSTGSFMPVPLNSPYCGSKAYVLNFADGISNDLKGTGITITTLCPGATRTEFSTKAGMDDTLVFKFMVMKASEVAKIGYKAMQKGKLSVVAGLYNKIMVFSIRFLPRSLVVWMGKYFLS